MLGELILLKYLTSKCKYLLHGLDASRSLGQGKARATLEGTPIILF